MGGGYGRFGERTCSFPLRQSFYKKGMALFACVTSGRCFLAFLYVRETRDHMHWLVLDRDRLQALALWDGAVAEGRNPWRFFFGFALALSSFFGNPVSLLFWIRFGSFFSSWTTGVWGFPVWTGGPLCPFSLVCPYRIHHVYPWCAKSIPRRPCDNGRSTAGKNGRQSAGNAGESRKGVRARRKSIGKWSRAMDPRRKWHRK